MIKTLIYDYKRSSKNKEVLLVLLIYRLGNSIFYSKLPKPIKRLALIPIKIAKKIFTEWLFHIYIPFPAKIGAGLRLVHLDGIVIHASAEIGNDCTIFHQVTIGANEHRKDYRQAAKIGNNVYIGAGSKIIGNINIGDGVRIGANAVVVEDIPQDSTIVSMNRTAKRKIVDNRRLQEII